MNLKNKSVVEYMDSIGVLNNRVLLAHAIHLNEKDLDIKKKREASIAYNPMTNTKGATGMAKAYEMLNKDIKVGLGTDGPMSSNQVDLFRTLSYASSMQRLKYNDRTTMTPDIVARMATIGGAKSTNMMSNYNPFATVVFQSNPSNVDTTIVNGKLIVEDKKLKTYDIKIQLL